MRSDRLAATLAVAVLALSVPGQAQETIRLTAIDAYAPTALWVKVFIDYYIPEVDERLAKTGNYRIKWNQAFGGTIAKTKGVLEALQYDLADIGIVTTPYHPDKVPFHNLPYVTPMVSADIGLVARTMSTLVERYPQLSETWHDYDQVYLITAGSIDSYLIMTKKPMASLEAYRGKKIAGVGLNLRYLDGLGATGVTSGLSDWYNSLATGLFEGVVCWAEAAIAYRLYEVAPYMLDVKLGAVSSKVVSVNRGTWDRLPEEVRQVLRETAADYRDELARETDRRASRSRVEFQKLGGTIVSLSSAQRQQWADGIPNLTAGWIAEMERHGLPGRDILRDYMDTMRRNDQPILRHWDRE